MEWDGPSLPVLRSLLGNTLFWPPFIMMFRTWSWAVLFVTGWSVFINVKWELLNRRFSTYLGLFSGFGLAQYGSSTLWIIIGMDMFSVIWGSLYFGDFSLIACGTVLHFFTLFSQSFPLLTLHLKLTMTK